ncbi:unnamed protein product [Tuber aestivum]|uniref:Uncharacterized protein n=1 Tax=Tuber aestivum TaxID=59557 RepID=A0A292PIL0_9PEZI|nr:unnamed protein product [Tuber aestivum]
MSGSVDTRFSAIAEHFKATHEDYRDLSGRLIALGTMVTGLSDRVMAHAEGQSKYNIALEGSVIDLTTKVIGLVTDVSTLNAATATIAAKQDNLEAKQGNLEAMVATIAGRQEEQGRMLQELTLNIRALVGSHDGASRGGAPV